MHRVEASTPQYQAELDFKELKLWKKVAAVAFVTFATFLSLGFFFDASFQYIVGRLSENKDLPVAKKVVKVDLTKKRESISDEKKKELEVSFNAWYKKQQPSRFEASTKRKRALKLAAFFVTENKKSDNVKLVLADILEARFKKEEELQKIANKPPSPPAKPHIFKPNKKEKEPIPFKITTQRKNVEGEAVVVQKEYLRWHTTGDGSCGVHALLGVQVDGTYTADLKKRQEFCDYLDKKELPERFNNQIEEVFEKLYLTDDKRILACVDALKPLYKEDYKKEVEPIVNQLAALEKKKELSPEDKEQILKLEDLRDAIQEKFFKDPAVVEKCVKKLKKFNLDLSGQDLAEGANKEGLYLDVIFKKLYKNASTSASEDGRINDYIKLLKPIFEKGFEKGQGYKAEIQSVSRALFEFEGKNIKHLSETAAAARKALIEKCNGVKSKFLADPDVKAAVIKKLRERGNFLFQHELIELAKKEKIPLVLHQKDQNGEEMSTKYINGEVVPNSTIYMEKDKAQKKDWVHVYYENSHYERVTKQKINIDFK